MSMSKQDFIALADTLKTIRASYAPHWDPNLFRPCDDHIKALAEFCASQNPNFKRDRWLDYIAGKCGPSGGAVKRPSCQCSDRGCPAHKGKSECSHNKRTTVYRSDAEDRTGTRMCVQCAKDALDSGVFYTK